MLLECVSVRLFEPSKAHLLKLLYSQLNQGLGGMASPLEACLYQSCDIVGDWTIQMLWQDEGPPCKTTLGKHLAEALRNLGFVHHTVWHALASKALENKPSPARGIKE